MTPSTPSVLVSVVVCTRNRAASLDALLDTASRLRIPARTAWEVIIVDNGSTDETAEVVRRHAGQLPIRRVEEPRIGLSHARNRGIAEARGRYLCWTDDDVRLDPDWLAGYVAAFDRHPDAAVFGGPILPQVEPPTPSWFARCSDCWPHHQRHSQSGIWGPRRSRSPSLATKRLMARISRCAPKSSGGSAMTPGSARQAIAGSSPRKPS